MMVFGKSKGGGRRSDPRQTAPLIALVSTLTNEHTATLVDVSAIGVRLRGKDLPMEGEELILTLESASAFGRVTWKHDGECGVLLGGPLPADDVEAIRQRAAELGCYPSELRAAFDAWTLGLVTAMRVNQ